MTGHSRETDFKMAWLETYSESSRGQASLEWENLLRGLRTSNDLQLQRKFVPPIADDLDHHMWVTAQGFPLLENGKVKLILGTLTDVSHLKWAESVQARSAQRASEAKRNQEEFIDMSKSDRTHDRFMKLTRAFLASHEMRNPLVSTLHND